MSVLKDHGVPLPQDSRKPHCDTVPTSYLALIALSHHFLRIQSLPQRKLLLYRVALFKTHIFVLFLSIHDL